MFYHILLHMQGQSAPVVQLDVDKDLLEREFLRPYRKGSNFFVKGKMLQVADLTQIAIYATAERSEQIIADLESQGGRIPQDWAGRARRVAECGQNVTRDFVAEPPGQRSRAGQGDKAKVFLIHGRWTTAVDAMHDFLASLTLHVVDWKRSVLATGKGTPYTAEILETGFNMCHVVLVFMTPDDVVAIHPKLMPSTSANLRLIRQPRPNVIFEAGMAWQREKDRTLIVEYGDLKTFSDLSGIDRIQRFDGSPQSRTEVANRLRAIGAKIDQGGKWLTAGQFPAPMPDIVADINVVED